jgi:hypothetical protein
VASLMIVAALALALTACGAGKQVDTSSYTCAQFNKSLAAKSDNSAGNFISRLRDQAKLGQSQKAEQREVSLGVYFACLGKPGSTRPAERAIAIAKQLKAGTFHLPKPGTAKKRSGQ